MQSHLNKGGPIIMYACIIPLALRSHFVLIVITNGINTDRGWVGVGQGGGVRINSSKFTEMQINMSNTSLKIVIGVDYPQSAYSLLTINCYEKHYHRSYQKHICNLTGSLFA